MSNVNYLSGLGWVIGAAIAYVGTILYIRGIRQDKAEQELCMWTGAHWVQLPPSPSEEEISMALEMIERAGVK